MMAHASTGVRRGPGGSPLRGGMNGANWLARGQGHEWVHARRLRRGNGEEPCIEAVYFADIATGSHVGLARRNRVRIIECIDIPAVGWDFRDAVPPPRQDRQEFIETRDVPWKFATSSHDRNRLLRATTSVLIETHDPSYLRQVSQTK